MDFIDTNGLHIKMDASIVYMKTCFYLDTIHLFVTWTPTRASLPAPLHSPGNARIERIFLMID